MPSTNVRRSNAKAPLSTSELASYFYASRSVAEAKKTMKASAKSTRAIPRATGLLAGFVASQNPDSHPVFEDGMVFVSVEGLHPRRAVLDELDYRRITSRDPGGAYLTRTRWWLDDEGLLRAYSLHEKPMQHGVLVAAAILAAATGDSIEMSSDPLDLRRSQLRKLPTSSEETGRTQ